MHNRNKPILVTRLSTEVPGKCIKLHLNNRCKSTPILQVNEMDYNDDILSFSNPYRDSVHGQHLK